MRKAVNFRAVKKEAKIITVSFRRNGEKVIFQKTQKVRKPINIKRVIRKRESKTDE